MKCVDLAQLAGRRYRLAHDPAAEHERGGKADPWLLTIPCQRGHFYPHSATDGRGPTSRKLASLPFVTITQDGADGVNLIFPAERFKEVAQIAKPRRRRQLTATQRAAARERLAKFAFSPARKAPENDHKPLPTA